VSAGEGDSIVIFRGARVPHVIRKRGDDWELIGDCYVHGIMHGSFFDEKRCKTYNLM
jgi:hypothetical protein